MCPSTCGGNDTGGMVVAVGVSRPSAVAMSTWRVTPSDRFAASVDDVCKAGAVKRAVAIATAPELAPAIVGAADETMVEVVAEAVVVVVGAALVVVATTRA